VLFTVTPGEAVHEIVRAALDLGGRLESVVPKRVSLEEVYLEVTRRKPPAPVEPAPAAEAVAVGGSR
jgi:hypothetical protein